MTVRLLTFAPMVDSELCRLLLAHYGVSYAEERHVFGWASLLALLRGGTVRIPLLYGDGLALAGPRALAEHYDRTCPVERKLLPARQPLRTAVEADWERFNGRLAADMAVFAYFHLLPLRSAMVSPLSLGLPPGEAAALRGWYYPVLRWLLATLLRLSPARAGDAWTGIRSAMDHTDAVLADGRPFIGGDCMTLADLALAAALVPLLAPPGYAALIPAPDQLPPAITQATADARSRPTAALAARVYGVTAAEPRG